MQIQTIKDNYSKKEGALLGKQNIEDSLAMLYHENSKFTKHSIRAQGIKIAAFQNPYITKRSSKPFKCYSDKPTYDLSDYKNFDFDAQLLDTLKSRRSIRDYDKNYKLSLNELAALLYNSYGVNQKLPIGNTNEFLGLRNIPSGGALYPLELYIIVFNAHISSGLYHYRSDINQLELLKEGNFMKDVRNMIQAEPYVNIKNASALIITTGLIERVIIKYGDRGYRFMLQESGFVGQTISLLAQGINLGSCMLGGFNDDLINNFLNVDGVFETTNNVIVIGKPLNNISSENEM